MALRKQAQENQVQDNAPAFEDMDEGVTTTVESTTPAANDAPASTSTSVAVAAVNNSVVAKNAAGAEFAAQVTAMKGALELGYGTFKSFKGNNGIIKGLGEDKDIKLGKWVKLGLLAWDSRFEVSPGGNEKRAKDFVAYSKDGVVVDYVIGDEMRSMWVGKKVEDYVQYLKSEESFPEAAKRPFIDIAGTLLECEAGDSDLLYETIMLSLSSSSMKSFEKYESGLKSKAMAAARGLPVKLPDDPFTFYVHTVLAEKGDKNWTKLEVASKLPSKL